MTEKMMRLPESIIGWAAGELDPDMVSDFEGRPGIFIATEDVKWLREMIGLVLTIPQSTPEPTHDQ
jgi:hypothetical protein